MAVSSYKVTIIKLWSVVGKPGFSSLILSNLLFFLVLFWREKIFFSLLLVGKMKKKNIFLFYKDSLNLYTKFVLTKFFQDFDDFYNRFVFK